MKGATVKQVIAIAGSALLLFLAYYGSYLPLRKSMMFIDVLRNSANVRSLQDFRVAMSGPLDAPSPIGQEELVRNVGNMLMGAVRSNNSPELINEAINYLDFYYAPIIARGRGMSFEQNLYLLGAINETAFVQTKEVRYLEAAKKYFSKGLELGPNRPQFLYGMFDVYRLEGNVAQVTVIANQILRQWPDDERMRIILAQYLAQSGSSTAPASP